MCCRVQGREDGPPCGRLANPGVPTKLEAKVDPPLLMGRHCPLKHPDRSENREWTESKSCFPAASRGTLRYQSSAALDSRAQLLDAATRDGPRRVTGRLGSCGSYRRSLLMSSLRKSMRRASTWRTSAGVRRHVSGPELAPQ